MIACFFPICCFHLYSEELPIKVKSHYALLINADNGKILYKKREKELFSPASLTKIGTLLTLGPYLKEEDFDAVWSCDKEALIQMTEQEKVKKEYQIKPYLLEPDGVTLWLRPYQRVTIGTLVHALMLRSANDAANQLAVAFGGSVEAFVEKMNQTALDAGCENTYFANPSGLFYPTQMTTALDLSRMALEILKNPLLLKIMSANQYEAKELKNTIKTTIPFLDPDHRYYHPQIIAAKTGYHRIAGFNLLAIVKGKERRYILVTGKAPTKKDRILDGLHMVEVAEREEKRSRLLYNKEEALFTKELPYAQSCLRARLDHDATIEYYPSEEPLLHTEVIWSSLQLPIKKGDRVAMLMIYDDKTALKNYPIFAEEEVDPTFWGWLKAMFFESSSMSSKGT